MHSMVLYPHDAGAMGGQAAVNDAKANQACYSCRKQKRRCDKALPSCNLCSRMGRTCDYSEAQPAPTAEDLAVLQLKLAELESRLNVTGGSDMSLSQMSTGSDAMSHSQSPPLLPRAPSWHGGTNTLDPAAFLDAQLFKTIGVPPPRPTSDLPPEIRQCIGDEDSIHQILADYFGDVHPWFPMISKKQMNLAYTYCDGGADSALLLMAMKLITSQPHEGFLASQTYIYTRSKQFLTYLESTGIMSLQYLQALLLVALYEYGQGIYPAAWRTVANCVRYSDFIGLPSYNDSSNLLGPCTDWVGAEERRRTWWAVYILDKLVSIGSQKRHLCCEPWANEMLPVDDKAWDTGAMSSTMQRTVSTPMADPQPPFARLCQTALLLGKVLRHTQRAEARRASGDRYEYGVVASLAETAHGLSTCLLAELAADPSAYFSLLPAWCLTLTAVMKVLGTYTADAALSGMGDHRMMPTDDDVAVQMAAVDEMRSTASRVLHPAADLSAYITLDTGLNQTSPFVLDALYSAAVALAGMWKESTDPVAEESLETTKKCLVRLSGRWRLGGEYLKLLEHHEMNVLMGHSFAGGQPLAGIPMVMAGMGV